MPLITFEGIEGCGKSSQAAKTAEEIRRRGGRVRLEREPGATEIGRRIREILLDPATTDLEPGAELLLMEADRRQHVIRVLRPALARGEIVLCDRYNDSSFAYQGEGRGLPREVIGAIDRFAADDLSPDLTLLFDCPVEIGLSRARLRDQGANARFENEDAAFHERVRAAYLEIARRDPGRVRLIDATAAADSVFEGVWSAVAPLLGL